MIWAKNAEKLGIDLSCVDLAVLSHGHYDHGGGLGAFLEANQKAPVYVHTDAFGQYYNGTEKYIGLNPAYKKESRLIFTKDRMEILPGMILTDCNDLAWEFDSKGLNEKREGVYNPDSFRHEQYLLINEGEKRILLSGCSHKGIVNIARHIQPDVLIGGFHLNKEKSSEVLQETARHLLTGNTQYYTGHCTGESQYGILQTVMADRLQPVSTGMVIEV